MREPYSFRDLILARKYAGLVAGGASWGAIARSVHRSGPVASLTAKSLNVGSQHGRPDAIYLEGGQSELDGQLLFDLGSAAGDDTLEDLFAEAESAEEQGDHEQAAALYQRCLAIDPSDAIAAFNRANCLRGAGRAAEAAHDYARAIKLDPGFVEAWFNLAGLMSDEGKVASARRHLQKAIALDKSYADPVFNLARLEFDAGNLPKRAATGCAISNSTRIANGRARRKRGYSSWICRWRGRRVAATVDNLFRFRVWD